MLFWGRVFSVVSVVSAFLPQPPVSSYHGRSAYRMATTDETATTGTFAPVFDFANNNDDDDARAVDSFDRIDDAIMGGISTSSLRSLPDEPFARWSGVCRVDGGYVC